MGRNLNRGVRKAIELAGGTRNALADLLNCTPEAVRKMEFVNCTAERAIEIETVINKKYNNEIKISREEIRPDLFLKNHPKEESDPIPTPSWMLKEMNTKHPQKSYTDSIKDSDDAQVIEPLPQTIADEISGNAEHSDPKTEVEKRIKLNPNVDIARPGRKLRPDNTETKKEIGEQDENKNV